MSAFALTTVIITAGIAVAVIAFIFRARRSQRLSTRFGPECDRAVQETGNKTSPEAKLEKLERRVERFTTSRLSPADRAHFTAAWQTVQTQFVDDPKGALTEADKLIQQMMVVRCYPITDFEQRAAHVAIDHPLVVEHYRAGHEIALRHSQGKASTEDVRQAMIHYRELFADLAGEAPEMARSASVGRA